MKTSISILVLAMLAVGSIVAKENGALSSRTLATAKTGFNLNRGNLQLAERAIDDRIIDRLGLFNSSRNDQSTRYRVSFYVEEEDSDWNFEVTVTMEF
jgi:hypothetical protein